MMIRRTFTFALLALLSPLALAEYPQARRGDVVDDYHGTAVADPYRWLEDTDSKETRAWIRAQNKLTGRVLEGLPGRSAMRRRLTRLWNYPRAGLPQRAAGRYFYRYNNGLQNQSVLMLREGLDGEPRVLLDPNSLSDDGTLSLSRVEPSPDGRLLAYGLSEAGSDWLRFQVMDVDTGQQLGEPLTRIKFSPLAWTRDSRGFFYSRYPAPREDGVFGELRDQKLYYHRVGTRQADDVLVMARPDQPQWGFDADVSSDGRYAIVSVWQGSGDENHLYVIDLGQADKPDPGGRVIPLIENFDAAYVPLGSLGSEIFLLTTDAAPRGRIVAVDLAGAPRWREVVPQGAGTIEFADLVGGRVVIAAMHDAVHRVSLHARDGRHLRDLATPGPGTVAGTSGTADASELFFVFESFLQPDTIYRADVDAPGIDVFHQPEIDFDARRYVTEQVFYNSRDGTRVPMFITRRKDLKRTGRAPVHLYAYGGFNISMTPNFRVSTLVWLERGGIYAMPNLRGGGEYGQAWHKAGTRANKQNVFDDFIAAANYLIDQGWTSPEHLAISGGSNGGLLVGAVLNQRPDLFAAALPAVGVMDMLRFHKFTIGWAWTGDYGSSDDPAGFEYLYAYSPYHKVRPGTRYPAVLVTTADHDDRVVPGHSFKYAAALQYAQAGDAPTLIRIETRAGHGAGKPVSKRIEETADRLAFIGFHTGLTRSTVRWQRLMY